MENLFKSLLKNYGYNHIGIVNEDKKIWGYVKDGRFHLCKDNLEEVSRSEAQLKEGVLVLILKNDIYSVVESIIRPFFQSYLVIGENNYLLDLKEVVGGGGVTPTRSSYSYGYIRINNKSVILFDPYAHNCNHIKRNTVSEVIELKDQRRHDRVFLEGKLEADLRYELHYEDYYFFVNRVNCKNATCIIYESVLGQIYKGDLPRLWIRENKSLMLIIVKEKEVVLSHIDGSQKRELLLPQSHQEHTLDRRELFVFEDTMLVPFRGSKGAMVINDTRNWCVDFTDGGDIIEEVENSIIALRSRKSLETIYYDIHGSFLGEGRGNYLIYETDNFTCYNPQDNKLRKEFWQNDFGLNSVKLKGVMRLDDYSIIVPPIFERIKVINSESKLFETTFAYWSDSERKEMKGLYSEDGIIGPLGVELERPNYEIVGYTSYLEKAKELRRPISSDSVSILKGPFLDKTEFIIFSYGNRKGLVYRGKRVTGLEFDDISGYTINLLGGPKGQDLTEEVFEDFEVTIHSREINSSCLLYKEGKVGIFISDNLYSKIEFDHVNVFFYNYQNLYYKVSKGGKESILNEKLEELIPFRNEPVDFIFPNSYISGGKLYNMQHQIVFDMHPNDLTSDKEESAIAYELVDWSIDCCLALAFKKQNEYAFFIKDEIVVKKAEEWDENGDVELLKEIEINEYWTITFALVFSAHDNRFHCYWSENYPEEKEYEGACEPYTSEELERMYWDAFDGDPSNYWNID